MPEAVCGGGCCFPSNALGEMTVYVHFQKGKYLFIILRVFFFSSIEIIQMLIFLGEKMDIHTYLYTNNYKNIMNIHVKVNLITA